MQESLKQCVFVIGMHRSGTSALTGCFHLNGYNIGKEPMPTTKDNPKGYFENFAIFLLNEKILGHYGLRWDFLSKEKLKNINQDVNSIFFVEIRNVIKDQFLGATKIIIKDPRISLFPQLWKNALEAEGYSCSFIICYRKPEEVIKSLHERDRFSYEKSSFMYSQYVLRAAQFTNKEVVTFIDFGELLKKKQHYLHEKFPHQNFESIASQITDFLERALNHFPLNSKVTEVAPVFLSHLYKQLKKENVTNIIETFGEVHRLPQSFVDNELYDTKSIIKNLEERVDHLENKSKDDIIKILEAESLVNKRGRDIIEFENNASLLREEIADLKKTKNLMRIEFEKNISLLEQEIVDIREVNDGKRMEFEKNISNLEEKIGGVINNYEDKIELIRLLNEEDLNDRLSVESKLDNKVKSLNSAIDLLTRQVEQEKVRVEQSRLEEEKVRIAQSLKFDNELSVLKNSLQASELELQLTMSEKRSLSNSLSHRLGFAITYPFRLIYESRFFLNVKFFKLIPFLFREIFRNPKLALRAMNPANISKLRYALSVESSNHTKGNVVNYFSELREIEEIGLVDHDIIFNLDEVGKIGDVLILRGWAISPDGIESIKIADDNQNEEPVNYGRRRPDVAIVYPKYSGVLQSEFYFKSNWNETHIVLNITSKKGEELRERIEVQDLNDWSSLSLNEQYQLFLDSQSSNHAFNIEAVRYKPLISIVVPVYNVDAMWLDKCVQSVCDQSYPLWELCLYDDCSSKQETLDSLKRWALFDERIKVGFGKENKHIVHATNQAINMSNGAYIGFLDNDDELTVDALLEVVFKLNDDKGLRLIYSDEDKIEMDGRLVEPHFKSDFNLDMIRSNNYISHFTVVERTAGEEVDWITPGMEGSQDHDFILKVIDLIDQDEICHIPKVLYHWRKIPGSTAVEYDGKDYAFRAGKKAIESHLKRNKLEGSVEKGLWPGSYRVRYSMNFSPLVSIIIPFRDEAEMLQSCIESIKSKTVYSNYEIILVDNGSSKRATLDLLNSIRKDPKIQQLKYDVPFNYSKINNWAVRQCTGEYILLLNNDIEVITEGWITAMLELCQRKDVGAVGAKLLYEDNTIQHAGVFIGIGGIAGHSQKYLHNAMSGYFSRHQTIQNMCAVTAACLLATRVVYDEVNGLEEDNLQIAFNDIDLCLKIREAGYLIAYTPYAELYHYESKSRGKEDTPEKLKRFNKEIAYFKSKWASILKDGDPYYNKNLSIEKEDFSLRLN